jgi:hypothetical protein
VATPNSPIFRCPAADQDFDEAFVALAVSADYAEAALVVPVGPGDVVLFNEGVTLGIPSAEPTADNNGGLSLLRVQHTKSILIKWKPFFAF